MQNQPFIFRPREELFGVDFSLNRCLRYSIICFCWYQTHRQSFRGWCSSLMLYQSHLERDQTSHKQQTFSLYRRLQKRSTLGLRRWDHLQGRQVIIFAKRSFFHWSQHSWGHLKNCIYSANGDCVLNHTFQEPTIVAARDTLRPQGCICLILEGYLEWGRTCWLLTTTFRIQQYSLEEVLQLPSLRRASFSCSNVFCVATEQLCITIKSNNLTLLTTGQHHLILGIRRHSLRIINRYFPIVLGLLL